ncbi:Major facilitator superfamily domain general substrate transporter [Penicillium taxi]|uniref:Major facilitator superfamily domain general substrate transporter n=1 Tax=Penicillium taxi TaxID=168475 RepID=UPI0025459C7C|nr:Major facilitator superfamily domain general substrate transporter [Penicillium taxi]KAJ5888980.1 Major facilitator superfamily domain general substrate transporter [Penicillium taxi]
MMAENSDQLKTEPVVDERDSIQKVEPVVDEQEFDRGNSSLAPPKTRLARLKASLWDTWDKSPEERKLVQKVDWWLLSYACTAYFIKSLDQSNTSNAYVSGMKEALDLKGNDLNYLTTYWNIGYIIGQIPSQLVLTKIRPSIWLPTLELIWSIFVMALAGAKDAKTIFILRFFIGLCEASAYPGIITLLGNWYSPQELGKRSAIFQASSSAANMFSGYLQAALYKGMNGRGGLAAWQWLFIFDGILGIPIALYGFWAIPDSPSDSKNRWLSKEETEHAGERMKKIGRAPAKKLKVRTFIDVIRSWPVWLFSLAFICHVLGLRIYSYFSVWLKSTHKYSVEQINVIPSAGYGLQIICTLLYAWTSDYFQVRWPIIVFACIPGLIGTIILSIWPIQNTAAMMAGWLLTYAETGAGIIFTSWISETCGFSAEHRVIVIGVVEAISFTFNAWVPLLAYNTSQEPRFKVGYQIAAMFFALEIIFTLVIAVVERRWPARDLAKDREDELAQSADNAI